MNIREELRFLRRCGTRIDQRLSDVDLMIGAWLKVRDKQGRLIALAPNRVQREFGRRSGKRNIVLKARQLGMTTYVAARFFVSTITRPGTLSVQVAHDQQSAEEIFGIVHRFLANLPEGMRKGALITSRANVRQIVFPRIDSGYRVETAADPDAGRGLTIQNLHCSEVARWPRDASETLASLRAAVPAGGTITLESTPAGMGGCFYQEWQRADETGYVRHFFPWWWDEGYRAEAAHVEQLTAEECDLIERYGLDIQQIAFRRQLRSNFGARAAQEFAEDANSCYLASGECVFEIEAIEQRLRGLSPALEQRDCGTLHIWWPATPNGGREYIVGVDPAGGGTTGDNACAQVIDRATGMQCAELYGHFAPQELARKVAKLGREYNEALVAVERNNHGHAVLALLELAERYQHVYAQGGQAGWLTTTVSRPRMLEGFGAAVRGAPELFSSARLLEECRTFVRHPDGRTAAMAGTHDDAVLAMAIALAVREEVTGQARRGLGFGSLQTM